jgi:hypothetical protein
MAMTSVADTRLLLSLQFPSDEKAGEKIRIFVQKEMANGVILPSIVISEFIKIAGSRIGVHAAIGAITTLKERGMKMRPIDEELALEAGKLLLKHRTVPFADSLVAAFTIKHAEYVLSDDPHFKDLGSRTKWFP